MSARLVAIWSDQLGHRYSKYDCGCVISMDYTKGLTAEAMAQELLDLQAVHSCPIVQPPAPPAESFIQEEAPPVRKSRR
jgi:hypothetical protein